MTARGSSRKPQSDDTAIWAAGRLGKKRSGSPEVIFAQVHEDAAVEVAALAGREPPEVAFCIGSGGCTAFSLLTGGLSQLSVVDINPAQIYLLELKKAALEHLPYSEMLGCMTSNARAAYPALRPSLSPHASTFWDRREQLLALGLNQCGIIERGLKRIMRLLPLLVGRRCIDAMFGQTDLAAQQSFYRAHWDNYRWKRVFRWALSRPALRLFYGRQFVERVPADFSLLIKERIDAAFLNFPIGENGYLWQTFRSRYPPGGHGLPIYLRREHHGQVTAGLARAHLSIGDAAAFLEEQPSASIGFFALSNILEVAAPEYAGRLVEAIGRAAKPGAVVCLRSIFPPAPDLLGRCRERLTLDGALSEELARIDRSLFCKFIQVYRVDR